MKIRFLIATAVIYSCAFQAVGESKKIIVDGKVFYVAPSVVYATCTELVSEHLFDENKNYLNTRSGAGSTLPCAMITRGESGGLGILAAKEFGHEQVNVNQFQQQQ